MSIAHVKIFDERTKLEFEFVTTKWQVPERPFRKWRESVQAFEKRTEIRKQRLAQKYISELEEFMSSKISKPWKWTPMETEGFSSMQQHLPWIAAMGTIMPVLQRLVKGVAAQTPMEGVIPERFECVQREQKMSDDVLWKKAGKQAVEIGDLMIYPEKYVDKIHPKFGVKEKNKVRLIQHLSYFNTSQIKAKFDLPVIDLMKATPQNSIFLVLDMKRAFSKVPLDPLFRKDLGVRWKITKVAPD